MLTNFARTYCVSLSVNYHLSAPELWVVAKGDAREAGDRELELFQICHCQSTSLPELSVNFFR